MQIGLDTTAIAGQGSGANLIRILSCSFPVFCFCPVERISVEVGLLCFRVPDTSPWNQFRSAKHLQLGEEGRQTGYVSE